MAQTVTAAYDSEEAARNAVDELISDGYDQEKVFLDKENIQVKVMVPDSGQREAEEILKRHSPKDVWARPVQ